MPVTNPFPPPAGPVTNPLPSPAGADGRGRLRLGVLALFVAVLLAGVWLRPLIPIDETRYVSVAWEMWHSGEWLVPHKNGAIYTDKPPLLFWLINLVWRVAGVGENAAQLVSPLFAIACVGGVGLLAARLWPDRRGVGTLASVVLAGFLVFALYGGGVAFDAMLSLATLLGIGSLVVAIRDDRLGAWATFGIALAFGVHAKGPVILLHLLPALLLYPLWTRRGERATPRRVALGVLLAVAVAALGIGVWLLPALREGGEVYRDGVLWEQSAGRVVDAFAHARPFWFYAALLPLLLFPWGWSRTAWRGVAALVRRPDAGTRLCLVWGGATFVLFSLVSGKQVHYLVPMLPAVALLVARALLGRIDGRAGWRHPAGLVLALAGVASLAAAAGLLPLDAAPFGASPAGGLALVGAGLLLAWIAVARLPLAAGLVTAGLAPLLAFDLLVATTGLGAAHDAAPIARLIAPYREGGLAVVTTRYNAEFNFAARLEEPVAELETAEALDAWVAAHPDGAVVAREDGVHPSWSPVRQVLFRGRPYAVWTSAEAPHAATSAASTAP